MVFIPPAQMCKDGERVPPVMTLSLLCCSNFDSLKKENVYENNKLVRHLFHVDSGSFPGVCLINFQQLLLQDSKVFSLCLSGHSRSTLIGGRSAGLPLHVFCFPFAFTQLINPVWKFLNFTGRLICCSFHVGHVLPGFGCLQ